MAERQDIGGDPTLTSHEELGGEPTLPSRGAAVASAAPKAIGRYQVLRMVGVGGMGMVYAAQDPELGRKVAIKVVRERLGDVGSSLRERLRREAQALARLTHPNVVPIFDVGVDGEQLFIVMHYVDGAPLDDWIASEKADRDAIVQLYLQAGRGLAAAHAAGLVHRDFKPGNVLVEKGGHVRVTDFGLARLSHLADAPSSESLESSGDALLASMTRGDVVGTPAYMAPEQHMGGAITAATDQFGFCVALWEALTGARPFAGENVAAVREAVRAGKLELPAKPLPRRLHRALVRGLSVKASDRWPSMDALIAQLEPPRRWWLAAGAAAVLVGGGALAAVMATSGGAAANPCKGADAAIDDVWTPARREALRASLASLGTADSATLADALVAKMDKRARTWRTMRIDTCEASRMRHSEDAAVTTRRTACLDHSLDGIRATLDALGPDASREAKANGLVTASSGVPPDDCTAAGTARGGWDRATPPELSRRLAAFEATSAAGASSLVVRDGPALADALEAAGDLSGAASVLQKVARKAGALMPVEQQRDTARRAAILAAKVGNDRVEALAWMSAAIAAADSGDSRGVDDLLAQASAAAARSGDPELPLEIDDTHGEILIYAQRFDEAIAVCQKALDTARTAYGDTANSVDDSLRCLATAYYQAERWDDAKRVSAERLELTRKIDGENAGVTLDATRAVALATFWGGDREGGRAQLKALIAKEAALSGEDSLPVLETTWKLALAESHDGALATSEAMEASERAAALAEKLLPADDLHRATVLSARADVLQAHGDTDASLAEYEKVLAIYDQIDNVALWAPVAYNVADGYASAGKCDHAEPLLTRLIAAADAGKTGGSIGPTSHGLLGVCEIADKKLDVGIVELRSAIADCDKLGAIEFAAQFRIELAKGLLQKGDRAAARKLLKEVDTTLPHDDDPVHDLLRKMAKDVHA